MFFKYSSIYISGVRNGNLLQYSCLENPMDRVAWKATFHGFSRELDTAEWVNNNNVYVKPNLPVCQPFFTLGNEKLVLYICDSLSFFIDKFIWTLFFSVYTYKRYHIKTPFLFKKIFLNSIFKCNFYLKCPGQLSCKMVHILDISIFFQCCLTLPSVLSNLMDVSSGL